jgi:hypothetical protein
MPVSRDDLIAKLETFIGARDAAASAHTATLSAKDNVTSVTVTEQAKIDAAVANFDIETTKAKADESAAEAAEDAANAAENAALDDLESALRAFKDDQ